ncbi:MAG: OmpA family protein [Saprospiraceae bacterium]
MAINILDLFKNQILGELTKSASGILGESEQNTKSALESIAPTVLGSLVSKAGTESGASSIMDLLKGNSFDTDILSNVSGLLSGGESGLSKITSLGAPVIKMLFGDKIGSIVDWISSKNNIKSSSVTSLFSMAAPFIMNLIGKQVKSQNLGLSGLMNLLGGQGSFVKSLIPAGLSSLTNFNFSNSLGQVNNELSTKKEKAGFGRFWPWLLLLLLLALLWYFLRGCDNNNKINNSLNTMVDSVKTTVTDVADNVSEGVSNAVDGIKGTVDAAGNWISDLGKEISIMLPGNVELKVGENSIENKLVEFIKTGNHDEESLKNTWFTMDRLYFETGKSTLTADSEVQLKNIAAIMKAYPNVSIKLGGYTDSDGDEAMNQKLSESRAVAAKYELQKLGVPANRMETEGYGEQYPVCPANDTPECKAQNRRIDIRVTKI